MRLKKYDANKAIRFACAMAAIAVFALAVAGCGAARLKRGSKGEGEGEEEKIRLTAEDLRSRAVLDTADLTTAVDESRFRAAAPAMTEFPPTQKAIYLVGKLKRVPTDARIEVRWFMDVDPTPMLVSEVRGSDTYEFIASFSPTDRAFLPGSYMARVYVDDREVGAREFRITGEEMLQGGPMLRRLSISTRINRRMQPQGTSVRFDGNPKQIFASFDLKNVRPGMAANVTWLRNGELFHEADIDIAGDRRYAAQISSPAGLPPGRYQVEIEIDGNSAGRESFNVGEVVDGSRVDMFSLGIELDQNNVPVEKMNTFGTDAQAVMCGLRFLDLPPDAAIEIYWIKIEEDGEMLIYTNRSILSSGGSGTMGAEWRPTHAFEPGDYKAVVLINGEALAEEKFKVE